MTDLFNDNIDMVYNTSDGNATAGGYTIDSLLLNQGLPALYDDNNAMNADSLDVNASAIGGANSKVKDNKFSDRFKHLAVPAGLLYINTSINKSNMNDNNVMNDSNVINDDLYEKLLKLAQPNVKEVSNIPHTNAKNKKTKKRANKINKKKTKRRY